MSRTFVFALNDYFPNRKRAPAGRAAVRDKAAEGWGALSFRWWKGVFMVNVFLVKTFVHIGEISAISN